MPEIVQNTKHVKMEYNKNSIQHLALNFINRTNRHIFLTGKAGTGKTTFLRHLKKQTHKNIAIVAPTGIAAINAGGVTIHSMFQLPFGAFIPNDNVQFSQDISVQLNTPYSIIKNHQMSGPKRKIIRELDLLIIDEVSMLRADMLDAIDTVMRSVRKRQSYKPFGGVQILFIGDLQQLPPVVKDAEWAYLRQYYRTIHFFEALALKGELPLYVELDKIYRQSDTQFIELLNHIREDGITQADVDLLNQHYKRKLNEEDYDGFILLTTHNRKADQKNFSELDKITTKKFTYKAGIEGDFKEHLYPVDSQMELKVGAQVMFIKNDPTGEGQFFNGKIGKVHKLERDVIGVKCEDKEDVIAVEKYEWENVRYELNEETNEIEKVIIGKFKQYPLKLAWAITVHKSQGLTFEKAIIDVNSAFAPGQVYVALSRLTSLKGLVLNSIFRIPSISRDRTIDQYEETKESKTTLDKTLLVEEMRFLGFASVQAFDVSRVLYLSAKNLSECEKSGPQSIQHKYIDWSRTILDDLKTISDTIYKFERQLNKICESTQRSSLKTLHERVQAANGYFLPMLKKVSITILETIAELKHASKTKVFQERLDELEKELFKCRFKMVKAEEMIYSAINNIEFAKEDMQKTSLFTERAEELTNFNKLSKAPLSEESKKRLKKSDTKQKSLEMFNDGKSAEEIAEERNLSTATIAKHLAYFIEEGEIDSTFLIHEDKKEIILKAIEEVGVDKASPIKSIVGKECSFEEIRYVMAEYKYQRDK